MQVHSWDNNPIRAILLSASISGTAPKPEPYHARPTAPSCAKLHDRTLSDAPWQHVGRTIYAATRPNPPPHPDGATACSSWRAGGDDRAWSPACRQSARRAAGGQCAPAGAGRGPHAHASRVLERFRADWKHYASSRPKAGRLQESWSMYAHAEHAPVADRGQKRRGLDKAPPDGRARDLPVVAW